MTSAKKGLSTLAPDFDLICAYLLILGIFLKLSGGR